MKVHICNLGPVKEADLEIKPFTVFIGPNNSGKSWTAYALAGLLGPDGFKRYIDEFDLEKLAEIYPSLNQTIEQALIEGNARLDMVEFAKNYAEIFFNDLFKHGKNWLKDIIGTHRGSFEKFEAKLELAETKAEFLEQIRVAKVDTKISPNKRTGNALVSIIKETGNPILYFIVEAGATETLPSLAIKRPLVTEGLRVIQQALYPSINILPVERAPLVEELVNSSKNSPKVEAETTNKLPVTKNEYWPIIIASVGLDIEYRQSLIKEIPEIKTYLELADSLEKEILGGSVNWLPTPSGVSKELLFEYTPGSRIEMQVAPSMVKELSPLVLYLRFTAQPRDWLIIDEPEMNLHPEAQAKITELLAMLVNSGLQVLVTTHSPYLVDHLGNLMKAASVSEQRQEVIKDRFYFKSETAFIKKDDIAAYFFNKGTAESVFEEEGYINWETFSNVSDDLNHLYFDIEG